MNILPVKSRAYLLAAVLACTACDESPDQKEVADSSAASTKEKSVESQAAKPPKAKAAETVSYECPSDAPTVIGICLGLTPEQVIAALKAHNEDIPIQKATGSYDYTDGAQKLRTEPFVSRIRAEPRTPDVYFEFHFTAPPGESKLTHMQRTLGQEGNNMPAMDKFTDGLIAKYGEPDYRYDGETHNELFRHLRWDFPDGRVLCTDVPLEEGNGLGKGLVSNATGKVGPSGAVQIAARLADKGVADPAQCGKWLQVQLRTYAKEEPVRMVTMELSDFATTWTSANKTFAWLDKLEADARKERLQGAEMPEL